MEFAQRQYSTHETVMDLAAIMQRGSMYGQMDVRLWLKTDKLDVILVYEGEK